MLLIFISYSGRFPKCVHTINSYQHPESDRHIKRQLLSIIALIPVIRLVMLLVFLIVFNHLEPDRDKTHGIVKVIGEPGPSLHHLNFAYWM